MARIIDVSTWYLSGEEWLGDQEKIWIRDSPESDVTWLFKPQRRVKRLRRGDRPESFLWSDAQSEFITSRLARLLGLPAAHVELAERNRRFGCISRSVVAAGEQLHSGDVHLVGVDGGRYVPNSVDRRDRTGHTLEAIGLVLEGSRGSWPCEEMTAPMVFAGYLVLDAWVANGDRHSDNWAIIDDGSSNRLAPSFDHGSALAAGLADDDLIRRTPEKYAMGGMASRFEDGQGTPLVEYALRALDRWGGPWLERLAHVDHDRVERIVRSAPRLSERRRTFVLRILAHNQRRLIDS